MDRHVRDRVLQARAIRALASGMDWPMDVQKMANFDYEDLLKKTVLACSVFLHGSQYLVFSVYR